MGVIKNRIRSESTTNHPLDGGQALEDLIVVANQIDDGEAQQELNALYTARLERQRIRRLNKQKQVAARPEPTFRSLGCKGKSQRKYRRYENANLLGLTSALFNENDCLFTDISFEDFVPSSPSAISKLIQKESMKLWSAFIEASEEEQIAFVGDLADNASLGDESEGGLENGPDGHSNRNHRMDERQKHPASCPEESFRRLNADVKNALKKKRVPLGLLASIEDEITAFFMEQPLAIYKSCLPTGYERLLLHACCQYANLFCQSFDKDGSRWSRVRNPNEKFEQPSVTLSRYLAQKSL